MTHWRQSRPPEVPSCAQAPGAPGRPHSAGAAPLNLPTPGRPWAAPFLQTPWLAHPRGETSLEVALGCGPTSRQAPPLLPVGGMDGFCAPPPAPALRQTSLTLLADCPASAPPFVHTSFTTIWLPCSAE